MGEWFTMQTLIAFALGVALATWVKSMIAQVKGKVTG